jgi:hypothetical protein
MYMSFTMELFTAVMLSSDRAGAGINKKGKSVAIWNEEKRPAPFSSKKRKASRNGCGEQMKEINKNIGAQKM